MLDRLVQDDLATRGTAVLVGLGQANAHAAPAAPSGVALVQEGIEPRIPDPHEPLALALLGPRLQLLGESAHHAGLETPTFLVAGDAMALLVLAPQPRRGLEQEAVHVGRDLEVGHRAAELEHATTAAL